MARRIRKTHKEEQRELEAPEVVEQKLGSLSEWMEKHWRPVLAGLVGVSILWGGVGIYQIVSSSSAQKHAESSAAIFEQAAMPVVIPPEKKADEAAPTDEEKKAAAEAKKNEPPSFPSDKARAEAVIKAATPEAQKEPLVGVIVGGAKAVEGDFAAQLAAVDAALAQVKGTALELPLHVQKATALAGLERTAEAAAEWAQVQALDPTLFGKVLAQVRQGDLYNPTMATKTADAAKAKAAYEAALKSVRGGDAGAKGAPERDPPAGPLAFLAADVRLKLARL